MEATTTNNKKIKIRGNSYKGFWSKIAEILQIFTGLIATGIAVWALFNGLAQQNEINAEKEPNIFYQYLGIRQSSLGGNDLLCANAINYGTRSAKNLKTYLYTLFSTTGSNIIFNTTTTSYREIPQTKDLDLIPATPCFELHDLNHSTTTPVYFIHETSYFDEIKNKNEEISFYFKARWSETRMTYVISYLTSEEIKKYIPNLLEKAKQEGKIEAAEYSHLLQEAKKQ